MVFFTKYSEKYVVLIIVNVLQNIYIKHPIEGSWSEWVEWAVEI